MLFYGVFGTILGGRLGYVLFYKPLTTSRTRPTCRASGVGGHEVLRRLSRRHDRALVLCPQSNKRWLDVMDFVAPRPAAGRIGNFINGGSWVA